MKTRTSWTSPCHRPCEATPTTTLPTAHSRPSRATLSAQSATSSFPWMTPCSFLNTMTSATHDQEDGMDFFKHVPAGHQFDFSSSSTPTVSWVIPLGEWFHLENFIRHTQVAPPPPTKGCLHLFSSHLLFGLFLVFCCCKKGLFCSSNQLPLGVREESGSFQMSIYEWQRKLRCQVFLLQMEFSASSWHLPEITLPRVEGVYNTFTCTCGKSVDVYTKFKHILFIQKLFYHNYQRCATMLDFQLFRLYLTLVVLVVSVVLIYANSYHSNRPDGMPLLLFHFNTLPHTLGFSSTNV